MFENSRKLFEKCDAFQLPDILIIRHVISPTFVGLTNYRKIIFYMLGSHLSSKNHV